MQITEIAPDGSGKAELDGTSYQVDLSLIDSPQTGDFVIVHAGFAIEKLDKEEADARINLFEELAETQQQP